MGFESFLGNEKAVAVLRQMLERHRVPGALLLTGPKGVGKFTLACWFARAALCEKKEADFCEKCTSCRALAALDDLSVLVEQAREARGRSDPEEVPLVLQPHPDVSVVVPDPTYIRMSQMRAVRKLAYGAPTRACRFILIDDAERLRPDFAGALLKVLEEPPIHTHFLLVSHAPYELPATIRSRTVPLHFAPLPREAIGEYLAKHRPKMPKTDKTLAASMAAGSLGTALQLDLEHYREVREAALNYLLASGVTGEEARGAELFTTTAQLTGRSRRGDEEDPGGGRAEFEFSLEILYSLLSDVLYLKTRASTLGLRNPDVQKELEHLSRRVDLGWIAGKVSGLDRIERGLRRNLNRQLALDALAFGWSPANFGETSERLVASD